MCDRKESERFGKYIFKVIWGNLWESVNLDKSRKIWKNLEKPAGIWKSLHGFKTTRMLFKNLKESWGFLTASLKDSEKIRKSVKQSVSIRKNPKESERKNLKKRKESGIFRKNKKISEREYQEGNERIWKYLKESGGIWDYLRETARSERISEVREVFKGIWGNLWESRRI